MSNSILGICGFQSSGKNTAGEILISDYGFRSESFAKPLKDAVSVIFGWEREMLEGETKESRLFRETPDVWWEEKLEWSNTQFVQMFPNFTPRAALQLFGSEVFRQCFNDSIWIHCLENRLRNNTGDVVITDCRFPNEIDLIRKLGGKVIRVKRGTEPDWYETAIAANSNSLCSVECAKALTELGIHMSEWAWIGIDFDAVIENDSTLEQLHEQVKNFVNS